MVRITVHDKKKVSVSIRLSQFEPCHQLRIIRMFVTSCPKLNGGCDLLIFGKILLRHFTINHVRAPTSDYILCYEICKLKIIKETANKT